MKKLLPLALALVLAFSLAACGSPVRLSEEGVNTLKVGEKCSFREEEKQSIPYRWRYTISDESLMGVFQDEYKSDIRSKPTSGGDRGWRNLSFEALAPGECVIELRYEDIRDGTYSQSYTYTVVSTAD